MGSNSISEGMDCKKKRLHSWDRDNIISKAYESWPVHAPTIQLYGKVTHMARDEARHGPNFCEQSHLQETRHFPLAIITSYSKHQPLQRHELFTESTITEKPYKLFTSTVELVLILRHEPIQNTGMSCINILATLSSKLIKSISLSI